MELLNQLDPLLKAFWLIAIPTSLIFGIQTVLTFMGVDASDGIDADFDGDLTSADAPFQLFSLRNLINFLLGFSWTGISLFDILVNKTLLLLFSLAVGLLFIYLFYIIIKEIHKLAEDNSFRPTQALNKTAEVYLSIPERKTGVGKILISINGAYRELEAMTEHDRIPSNAVVRVSKIEKGTILIVETI